MKKSIGQLIDELITTSMKVWAGQEIVAHETDDNKVAAAARNVLRQNMRRTKLIQEIDERLALLAEGKDIEVYDGSKTF